ncbi:hypothetical protein CHLRE_08g370500v5 [Chlamydomonas reinhardtii]|uniref:gamma-glutamylcyclotransferase n=1 Tax=Chlamydomonas reinhardtii TaxID=3055 RepID=A0A2K3DH69_CHLRE|nr:uncharacterized protein CHLRE_08g370500v5 [Chlamydomonas reinhardtii]PNW79884.1 hypothetical protein CHLRE_08g370500v5 [Chlamydomonas reinhardtii]
MVHTPPCLGYGSRCQGSYRGHTGPAQPRSQSVVVPRAFRGKAAGGRASSAWTSWLGPKTWRNSEQGTSSSPSEQQALATQGSAAPPSSLDGPGSAGAPGASASGTVNGINATHGNRDGSSGSSSDGSSAVSAFSNRGVASGGAAAVPRGSGSGSAAKGDSGSGTDMVLTFAYGANLNFMTLARRDVKVLSRDPATVVDPAIHLVFKHQGGYATLERAAEPGAAAAAAAGNGGSSNGNGVAGSAAAGQAAAAEGAGAGAAAQNGSGPHHHHHDEPRFRPYDGRVHGVLYRLTREDFEKLSKREGGYTVQEMDVRTYDGVVHRALVFVSNPLFKLPQEVLPTEAYLSKIREGAADNYLDPSYQAFLSGITTVPSAGLGSEYFNTPSKYMGYSFLVVVALITLAFFFQH